MQRISAALAAFLLTLATSAQSVWGERDCGFGTSGTTAIAGTGTPGAIVREPDGNLLVINYPSSGPSAVVRLTADGTLLGELSALAGTYGLAVLASGDILFMKNSALGKASAAGVVDSSFGSGGFASIPGYSFGADIIVQLDGRIVVGGSNGTRAVLVRFNADGSPDGTFGISGVATSNSQYNYESIALHPDGRFVATTFDGLAQHLANGQLDASFGPPSTPGFVGTRTTGSINLLVRALPSGSTLLAQVSSNRVFSSGLVLQLFDASGAGGSSAVTRAFLGDVIHVDYPHPWPMVHVTGDGDIVVGGYLFNADIEWGGIARYSADLTLETSWVTDFVPAATYVLPNGKIVTRRGRSGLEVRGLLGDSDAPTCPATTTTLIADPNPSVNGQAVTLTATVASASSTPTGLAAFIYTYASPSIPYAELSGGIATNTQHGLPTGTQQLSAIYVPQGPFAAGTSNALTHTVLPAGTRTVSVSDAAVLEGQSGVTLLGFKVSVSVPSGNPVSVTYATANDTAVAGVDYSHTSGTLTFYGGSPTEQWIMVPVLGNLVDQLERRLFVNISNPQNASIGDGQGVGTIVDDDPVSAATTVPMYRLYSDVTKEHLYTTDLNEYSVLGTQNWVQEGTAYTMFGDSGSYGAQYAIPLYRMYHPAIRQHHWTTDSNEVVVLAGTGAWQYEGIPGYLLPTADAGTTPLYRLMYTNPPLHLWTTDANETNVLSTQYGWTYEGIVGEVLP